jgi:hypothetical protein
MNLFAAADQSLLVGPASLFDREQLLEKHDDWGHQLLRAATALEMLAQITERYPDILLKAGTLLGREPSEQLGRGRMIDPVVQVSNDYGYPPGPLEARFRWAR